MADKKDSYRMTFQVIIFFVYLFQECLFQEEEVVAIHAIGL